MPELPEVETVKEILKKQIIGKTIKEVKVYYEGILENVSKEDFCKLLINEQIVNNIIYYLMIATSKQIKIENISSLKNKNEDVEVGTDKPIGSKDAIDEN